MTINEIMERVTVLRYERMLKPEWVGVALFLGLAVYFVICAIKDWLGSRFTCLTLMSACIFMGGISFLYVVRSPMTIKIQITAKTEDVTVSDLNGWFECSDIAIGDGELVCTLAPKTYGKDKTYAEVNAWLKTYESNNN